MAARRNRCPRKQSVYRSKREVNRAVQTFTIAAEEAKRIPGEVIPLDWTPGTDSHLGILRRVPIGPVLGITPFNFPLNLVAHKVAPALAAGNSILIKPAPQTPLTALLLGEVVLEAGLPPGALNILPCDNRMAEQLVVDPRFKLLSFTGSAAVGWMLKAKCGKKKVVLELGGNAGVIVEPDADLELAAQRCAVGGFGYAGQSCISIQRIFVHHSIADLFTTKLLLQVARMKAGDPSDEFGEDPVRRQAVVPELRARLVLECPRLDLSLPGCSVGSVLDRAAGQPTGERHHLLEGDRLFAMGAELRPPRHDRQRRVEPAPADELEYD